MGIDDMFAFGAQQQVEAWNRIAAYKEKQAAHELLVAQNMHETSQLALSHAKQSLRPSLIVRPLLRRNGEEWIAAHGECEGRGLTPDLAYQDFDSSWMGRQE